MEKLVAKTIISLVVGFTLGLFVSYVTGEDYISENSNIYWRTKEYTKDGKTYNMINYKERRELNTLNGLLAGSLTSTALILYLLLPYIKQKKDE